MQWTKGRLFQKDKSRIARPGIWPLRNKHSLLTSWEAAYWQKRQSIRHFRQRAAVRRRNACQRKMEGAVFGRN